MSATDELRRMLDERGVEYETYVEQPTGFEHVKWNFNEHGSADFNIEFGEPWLTMYGTISGPEQAIEATLGRGELERKNAELRELVRDMWNWLAPTAIGGGAPMQGIFMRMRELGIEVVE